MLKVAITGNIASGKSQAEKYLLLKGFKVIDTDKIGHNLLETDDAVINEIKSVFKDVTDERGKISRDKLGKIIFYDPDKKKTVEQIIHKRIFEKVNEFFTENENEKIVFVAIPLLFETNTQSMFDKIIFVSADENIRLKRLMQRNGYSPEYAKVRIQAQDNEISKINKSDYVISNNSDIKSFEENLDKVLNEIIRN